MAEISTPRGSTPVPDPTELTDRAIAKAITAMRDYIDGQLATRDERLRGIDVATGLRLREIDTIPSQITGAIEAVVALSTQKFDAIQTQFRERDTRSERESQLNKIALDAAFSASKEAVAAALTAQKEAAARQDEANAKAIDKSERATAETIKTNLELTRSTTDALTKTLDELKIAVSRIESAKLGATENRTGLYATVGIIISIIVFGMGVLTFVATRPA